MLFGIANWKLALHLKACVGNFQNARFTQKQSDFNGGTARETFSKLYHYHFL